MYPNPQDALPLPARPSLEWYRKLAKDLTRACRSDDAAALGAAIEAWVRRCAGEDDGSRADLSVPHYARQITTFAEQQLRGSDPERRCTLASAQFVIARALGFASWPKLAAHVQDLTAKGTATTLFETAVDAIVGGDVAGLRRVLREHPDLARARSTRDHRATLLHYVSANGVESYRQKSPKNAPEITRLLLDAGAEVDAACDVYGGGATTLGLTATSEPPRVAGVQLAIIDVLLAHGARLEGDPVAGNRHSAVLGCLANGQLDAARYLADRGASLDVESAAGVGRLDLLHQLWDPSIDAPDSERVASGFAYACGYGHVDVVEFLLDRGVKPDRMLRLYGEGHTGLHIAAYHAHVEVMRVLLAHGAPVNVDDATWHTPPIVWALQGWGDTDAPRERYYEAVTLLLHAGAVVPDRILTDPSVVGDPRMASLIQGKMRT